MRRHLLGCLAAAGLIAAAATAAAQTPANQTASQNVRASQQYEGLLCNNPGFRAKRIAQECGPLQGSQLYNSCVASFNCKAQPQATHWRQAPPSETIK
jgi:hypothetical protein